MVIEEAVVAIVPKLAFPPAVPLTAQLTLEDALPAFETVAVKTRDPPAGTVPETGATITVIAPGVGCTGNELPEGADALPQAERSKTRGAKQPSHPPENLAMLKVWDGSLMYTKT